MSAVMETIRSMEEHTRQSYLKLVEKDATIPRNKNLANLPSTVRSIPSGGGDGTMWGTLYYGADDVLVLGSYKDYFSLKGLTSIWIVNGISINKTSIRKFSFGSACTFTPSLFMTGCTSLTSLDHLEMVRNIHSAFLEGADKFSQDLRLSAGTVVNGSFLRSADSFTGVLTIEDNVDPPADSQTLTTRNRTSPMYAQGVRITGPGAAAWKKALPDLDGTSEGRYRKLILV